MQQDSNRLVKTTRIRAVPAARRKAREKNIDLTEIRGSGPKGVILVRDVQSFQSSRAGISLSPIADKILVSPLAVVWPTHATCHLPRFPEPEVGKDHSCGCDSGCQCCENDFFVPAKGMESFGQTLPMSRVKKVTAKRMAQSAFTAPHIYFFADVLLDPLFHLRDEILPEFERRYQVRISFNDFFIKATALTIREVPLLNAKIQEEEIVVLPEINIGVAVAMEEGLMVPALPQADQLDLGEIAKMRNDLIGRARSGKLKLEEIERGTFTISSLAQSDILFFTAILNPPQSGILSIGQTTDRLFLRDGQVGTQKVARFGLSVDHRIIDGVMAAAFLQTLKKSWNIPSWLLCSFRRMEWLLKLLFPSWESRSRKARFYVG